MHNPFNRDPRDNLLVVSYLRVDGAKYPVVVRNVSSQGLKAVGDVPIIKGSAVELDVKNLGWVRGTVAWIKDKEFGVRLQSEIQPEELLVHISTPASQLDAKANALRFV